MNLCESCKKPFVKAKTGQRACSPRCAWAVVKQDKKAKRKKDRNALAKSKPLAWHLKRTEAAVNAFVRLRDAGKPCVSCGRYVRLTAGHFISVGHGGSALRFHPDNIHGQCVQDNAYRGGRIAQYRIGLIERIGLARVEWLEGPHETKTWTREELDAIRGEYKAKAKELTQ